MSTTSDTQSGSVQRRGMLIGILLIGRPMHLSGRFQRWSACGVSAGDCTEDRGKVNCLRCKRTKAYRKNYKLYGVPERGLIAGD